MRWDWRRNGQLEHGRGHAQGHDADGDVDVEDPPPRQVSVNTPPSSGPAIDDRAKVAPKYPWYRPRSRGETTSAMIVMAMAISPPAPSALDPPEGDQLRHVLAEAGQHRADQEDHDGELEDALATELVGELAVQRGGDGRGQQVGGHHPAHVVEPVQAVDDGGQGGADDGLVEGGQEHARASGR